MTVGSASAHRSFATRSNGVRTTPGSVRGQRQQVFSQTLLKKFAVSTATRGKASLPVLGNFADHSLRVGEAACSTRAALDYRQHQ